MEPLTGGISTTSIIGGAAGGSALGGLALSGMALPFAGVGLGFGIKALIDRNRIKAANRRINETNSTVNQYYTNDPYNSPYSTAELEAARQRMDASSTYQPMQNEMNRAFNESGYYQKRANIDDQINGNLYRQIEGGYQPQGLEALSAPWQLYRQGLNLDGSRNYDLPEKKYSSLFQNGQLPYYDSTDPSTYGNKNNTYTGGVQQNTYNGGTSYDQPRQNLPAQNGTPEDLQRYYSETLRPLANMMSNTNVDMIDTILPQPKQMQFLPTQQYNDNAFRPGGYFYGS